MGFWKGLGKQLNPFAKNPGGPRGAFREMLGIGGADMNRQEAAKNRDFQLMMSNTAHQREVADMRKAGLNPMLSGMGGGGATTASGAAATAPGGQTNLGELASKGIQSAIGLRQSKKENDLIDQQTKNAALVPETVATDNENTRAATAAAEASTAQQKSLTTKTNAEGAMAAMNALTAKSVIEQTMASAKNNSTAAERSSKMSTYTSPIKELLSPITEILHGFQSGSAAMNANRANRDPQTITLDTGHKINKKGEIKDPQRRK